MVRSTHVQSIDIDCNICNRSCVWSWLGQLIYSFGRLRVVAHEENDRCDRFLKERRINSTRLDQTRPQNCKPLLPLIPLSFCLLCCSCACCVVFSISSKGGMLIPGVALFFSCSRPTYLFHSWKMVNGVTFFFIFSKKYVYISLQILHLDAFSA